MRVTLALMLSFLAGCNALKGWSSNDTKIKSPVVDKGGPVPTEAQLVSYLNRESAKLRTIDCEDLDVESNVQGRRLPTLRGWLICDKPRNFRLVGKVAGMEQVDFGSNPERFWFWIKESPEPHVFHCAYTDYEKGLQLPFPFNPDWVVQALGMAEYGTDPGRFKLEPRGDTWELSETTTLQGRQVKKITVFNRKNVAPPAPQVMAHIVKDMSGKVICSATVKDVRASKTIDPKSGFPIVYPRKIVLEWPSEQVTMTLTLGDVKLNEPIAPPQAAKLFSLPNRKEHKTIDLAQMRANPTSRTIEQAGGMNYR